MSHYFTNNDDLESLEKTFKFEISKNTFIFKTDKGVFSRHGVDFGSQVLLRNIIAEKIEPNILDLGCGYGPIGIVLSKLFNLPVYSIDINDRAIRLTKENALLNHVSIDARVCDDITHLNLKFKTIILNPPIRTGKTNIFDLYYKSYQVLDTGGKLYIVIQKKQGAKSSYNKLHEIFEDVKILDNYKGYQVILAIKSQH